MAITVANAQNLNHFPTIIVNVPEVAWIQANNTCLVFEQVEIHHSVVCNAPQLGGNIFCSDFKV